MSPTGKAVTVKTLYQCNVELLEVSLWITELNFIPRCDWSWAESFFAACWLISSPSAGLSIIFPWADNDLTQCFVGADRQHRQVLSTCVSYCTDVRAMLGTAWPGQPHFTSSGAVLCLTWSCDFLSPFIGSTMSRFTFCVSLMWECFCTALSLSKSECWITVDNISKMALFSSRKASQNLCLHSLNPFEASVKAFLICDIWSIV